MSTSETIDSRRAVKCSFCNEEKSPSEIGEHLLMCGNKTEQCPNCEKYIRRAIFAYHYENNCANLDELNAGDKRRDDQHNDTPTTLHDPPAKPSAVVQEPTSPAQAAGSVRITYECEYCHGQWGLKDIDKHREMCVENLKNKRQKQSPDTHAIVEENPILDRSTNNETVPCEICHEPIPLQHFNDHEAVCLRREMERGKQDGSVRVTTFSSGATRITSECEYCRSECELKDIGKHREMCVENPKNKRQKQSPGIHATVEQNSNWSTNNETVFCEICQEPIALQHFDDHLAMCLRREMEGANQGGSVRVSTVSSSAVRTTYVCTYCRSECELNDIDKHREMCVENPKNKKQSPDTHAIVEQDPNQSTNNETVLCEICEEPIALKHLDDHEAACRRRETERAKKEGSVHVSTVSSSAVGKLYECEYCRREWELKDIGKHREMCLENPKNKRQKQSPGIRVIVEQNPILDRSTNNETVLCEICREPIALQHFDDHEVACLRREMERAKKEGRYNEVNQSDFPRCRYCNLSRDPLIIAYHEDICKTYRGTIHDATYASLYSLPTLFGSSRQSS